MEKVKIIKTYGMTTEIKVDSDGDLHISQGSDIIVIAQSNIPPPFLTTITEQINHPS